jgi:hypothetical protein
VSNGHTTKLNVRVPITLTGAPDSFVGSNFTGALLAARISPTIFDRRAPIISQLKTCGGAHPIQYRFSSDSSKSEATWKAVLSICKLLPVSLTFVSLPFEGYQRATPGPRLMAEDYRRLDFVADAGLILRTVVRNRYQLADPGIRFLLV